MYTAKQTRKARLETDRYYARARCKGTASKPGQLWGPACRVGWVDEPSLT